MLDYIRTFVAEAAAHSVSELIIACFLFGFIGFVSIWALRQHILVKIFVGFPFIVATGTVALGSGPLIQVSCIVGALIAVRGMLVD